MCIRLLRFLLWSIAGLVSDGWCCLEWRQWLVWHVQERMYLYIRMELPTYKLNFSSIIWVFCCYLCKIALYWTSCFSGCIRQSSLRLSFLQRVKLLALTFWKGFSPLRQHWLLLCFWQDRERLSWHALSMIFLKEDKGVVKELKGSMRTCKWVSFRNVVDIRLYFAISKRKVALDSTERLLMVLLALLGIFTSSQIRRPFLTLWQSLRNFWRKVRPATVPWRSLETIPLVVLPWDKENV